MKRRSVPWGTTMAGCSLHVPKTAAIPAYSRNIARRNSGSRRWRGSSGAKPADASLGGALKEGGIARYRQGQYAAVLTDLE